VQAGNQIGNEGAKAIAQALKANTSLQQLDLVRCTPFVLMLFLFYLVTVLCFRLRVLTRAVQAGNYVGVEGAEAIAEALRCNTSVHQLSLVR
jgi:Ran GTPase-activating protein (RanGAP) involved in mRNA processing and transport